MRRISKIYYVYILTNKIHTVLYIGSTSNLAERIYQHKHKLIPGFSLKYNLFKLIYFATFSTAYEIVCYERKLKGWTRKKKERLITENNPNWNELSC